MFVCVYVFLYTLSTKYSFCYQSEDTVGQMRHLAASCLVRVRGLVGMVRVGVITIIIAVSPYEDRSSKGRGATKVRHINVIKV